MFLLAFDEAPLLLRPPWDPQSGALDIAPDIHSFLQ